MRMKYRRGGYAGQAVRPRSLAVLSMILLLLVGSQALAATALETYWPLNNGDSKTFAYGAESLALSVSGYSGQYTITSQTATESASEVHQTGSGKVQVLSGKVGWITISFNPPIDLLTESTAQDGGTLVTQTTVTQRYAGSYPATFTVTIGMAGTVTVPAGTFQNCRSITVGEVANVPDQGIVSATYMSAILAPGVGMIRKLVDPETGTWADLVSGTIAGANLADGVCGSSNGQSFTRAPAGNLCSAGTASPVTGTGPWTWSCAKISGSGADAACSATLGTLSGDCDDNGSTTISEVQSAVNMFLGINAVKACVDKDATGSVSIAEVQKVINSFLGM